MPTKNKNTKQFHHNEFIYTIFYIYIILILLVYVTNIINRIGNKDI